MKTHNLKKLSLLANFSMFAINSNSPICANNVKNYQEQEQITS